MNASPLLLALALAVPALTAEATKTEKNVTIVSAQSSADGGSDIARERILDCIRSLPNPDALDAQISSQSVFVRGVNGEEGRNEWVKSYIARLDISYLTNEKDLIIVTTRSINGQPPVIREVDKTLRHTQTFVSNSTEGDVYGGRSDRQYYFTNADAAVRDVKARAKIWIGQQAAALCPAK